MAFDVPVSESEDERVFIPGYRNYLVYCDESGLHGSTHYGFGSVWMPWERRGDFVDIIRSLRERHRMRDEFKWNKVNHRFETFYLDLVEMFFRRPWLMFHCLIVERAVVDKDLHDGDYDLARRKHFAMLVGTKMRFLCRGRNASKKRYHVRVDRLPSRYAKADEAAERIVNNTLKKELGHPAVATLFTRDSKTTSGIGLADVLLGAVMDDWCGTSESAAKQSVKRSIAGHLGWGDLAADTKPFEWKFNIWTFYDPTTGNPRPVATRTVVLRYPMNLVEQRRRA